MDRKDWTKTDKQKHSLLVEKVEEFLNTTLLDENVMQIKNNLPNFEPSGAESALI